MVGALIGAGISVIGGLIKTSQANKREAEIQSMIDNYKMDDLYNAGKALQVDLTGAELKTNIAKEAYATQLEALRKSGTRGLVGGLPSAETSLINKTKQEIGADTAGQQTDINKIVVDEASKIRAMKEARQIADLQGLGNALSVATQDKQAGMGDIFSGLGSGFSALTTGAFEGLFGDSVVLDASTGAGNA